MTASSPNDFHVVIAGLAPAITCRCPGNRSIQPGGDGPGNRQARQRAARCRHLRPTICSYLIGAMKKNPLKSSLRLVLAVTLALAPLGPRGSSGIARADGRL